VGIDHLKGKSSSSLREIFGLFFSSLTLFLASIDFVKTSNGAYGLSLGVISTVICAAATYLVEGKKIGNPNPNPLPGPSPNPIPTLNLLTLPLPLTATLT